MREHKYRIYDKEEKKMIYFTLEDVWNNGYNDGDWLLEDKDVMDYTGLKDKNDKEIYEGDIVDYGTWDNKDTCERGVIEYIEKSGWYVIQIYSWYGGEGYELLSTDKDIIKVIGNIKQNPELLEK